MARTKPKPETKPKKRSIYGVHPGVQMVADWIASLKPKTGRSLGEWVNLAKSDGPADLAGLREWFKNRHGFGTNAAWWLADVTTGEGKLDGDPAAYMKAAEGYLRDMYAGPKEALRPLHDAILNAAAQLGEDVKACPCQTIVPLYRKHVFAQIKPSTRTRLDLGLALGHYSGRLPKRLIDTGGKEKKDRITHRIPIEQMTDIDEDALHWLKVAYDLDV
jgi:hypothetical protein